MANINEILSQINDAGGVARPTLYSVQIVPPKIFSNSALNGSQPRIDYFKTLGVDVNKMSSRLDMMCLQAELPSVSFNTSDARTYGSSFKIPNVDIYSDLNLEFIVGRKMEERNYFEACSCPPRTARRCSHSRPPGPPPPDASHPGTASISLLAVS